MAEVHIESDDLRVTFLPHCGGKISSLVERATGEEFLLPPAAPYLERAGDAAFEESDRGGFDECLPTVAACDAGEDHPAAPDHGELWRVPWSIESRQTDSLHLAASAPASGLRLARRAHLEGSSLHLHYELTNASSERRDWMWSAHPLLLVEPGDRILLPPAVTSAQIDYSMSDAWTAGATIPWPVARSHHGDLTDLSIVAKPDGVTAIKLFADTHSARWCALQRTRLGRFIVLRFPSSELPWLGMWLCRGAWPEHRVPRQFTVALEPTTAPTDSLQASALTPYRRSLAPGESTTLELQVDVLSEFDPLQA